MEELLEATGEKGQQKEEAAGRAEGLGQGSDCIMSPLVQDSPVTPHHLGDKYSQTPSLGIQALS